MTDELSTKVIGLCRDGKDKTAIATLAFEIARLESLLAECIKALEQNNTSSHPSARPLIAGMSPQLRDYRGRIETRNQKAANVVHPKWRD